MASESTPLPIRAVQKLMGAGASAILRKGFNSSKCKTEAKMATARIKLLRNKREAQLRQMRRDVAILLESGRVETAWIRVEHVIREQNIMAANEIIELFCELIVARLPIIAKQRDCPPDLKEGISSLIYASPRCSELPELNRIQQIFEKKYGKDFVSAATDLRPESGVNRMLIEKLSVRKPTGEFKLKVLKEIAKEYQVNWDATESEQEFLKPPEEVIEGPRRFSNGRSFPTKPTLPQSDVQPDDYCLRPDNNREDSMMEFKDPVSAAQAAAESAKKAIHAAQSAARFANQNAHSFDQTKHVDNSVSHPSNLDKREPRRQSLGSGQTVGTNDPSICEAKAPKMFVNSQSFNIPDNIDDDSMDTGIMDEQKILRRNSCTARTVHTDIKFDDSDGLVSDTDEEDQMELSPPRQSHPPPSRPAPVLPSHQDHSEESYNDDHQESAKMKSGAHVHPKLPDYEALAARFEALKSRGI